MCYLKTNLTIYFTVRTVLVAFCDWGLLIWHPSHYLEAEGIQDATSTQLWKTATDNLTCRLQFTNAIVPKKCRHFSPQISDVLLLKGLLHQVFTIDKVYDHANCK
jgi:hypothetical protein